MSGVFNKPVSSPFLIGRYEERARLHQLIDQAGKGQGQVVLLSGEAGIGKSRLAAEVKTEARARGFLVLQGSSFPADRSSPYASLLDLFGSSQAKELLSRSDANLEPVARGLSQLHPGLVPLGPMPPPSGEMELRALDPEQEKRRWFVALTGFFTSLATKQPLLLIIEDLHWSDETSLEFLLSMARRCADHPLLLIMTYRYDEMYPTLRSWLAQLDRERLAQELALAPLSPSELDAMLQAIFDRPGPVPADTLDVLYGLTEGNPFFVEEIVKSLVAAGAITAGAVVVESGMRNAEPLNALPIPRSIQAAVHQRTERLSAAALYVLILAAVAGRRFDFALLQRITHHDEPELLRLMKELISAQLVVEESEELFAFRHALTRQAIYAQLLLRERKALHRTIAETMEQFFASTPDAHLGEFAYHFHQAGVWDKALEYDHRAGERALSLYAPRAASEHLTRALEAARYLQLAPPAKSYFARGQAYATLGDFNRARDDYERAAASARNLHDGLLEWQSTIALGFLWASRDYKQAGEWFRRASVLAEQLADPHLRARSLNRLGNWLVNTGHAEDGLRLHQEALQLFEGIQDTQGMAETFDLLGTASAFIGDQVKAVQQFGHAIDLFRTLGDRQGLVSSLISRASQSLPLANIISYCELRTREECVHDAEEALSLARQIDSPSEQAFAENTLARTLVSFGEFGPALTHARESLRIATAIEHRQWLVANSACTGYIYYLLLAPAQARATWESGLSLARELGSTHWIAFLSTYVALACLLQHDLSSAKAALDAVMPREQPPQDFAQRHIAWAWCELSLSQGAPEIALRIAAQLLESAPDTRAQDGEPVEPVQPIPHLLKLKGEALMGLGRLEEAVEALESAKRGAFVRQDPHDLWTIHRSLGQLYHLLGREDDVREEHAAAQHVIEHLGATLDDAGVADMALRDQFVQTALNSLPRAKQLPPRQATRRAFGGLTARERQVAALIAQGKTSREIAEQLVVSERTAEVHVSNILGKLGFSSRAQIAAWAVEKGLTLNSGDSEGLIL